MIGIIGCGHMGEALLAGLLNAGTSPECVVVSHRREERCAELRERYGVVAETNNSAAARGAEIAFITVKPNQVLPVLEEIGEVISDNDEETVVVSMAAGIATNTMEDAVPVGTSVVRAMPNTPMRAGKGVVVLARGKHTSAAQMAAVEELLSTTSVVQEIAEEHMDVATALMGSSPGYIYLVAEALIEAGCFLGLSRDIATTISTGAIAGAGVLLTQPDATPAALKAEISTPGGTTVAALRELEESGIRKAFYRATEACARRSRELGSH
ncbi:pyrroline-5-carboxylate reductase [Corynebacterium caspium]|uniref:pyrroline-5-carboxylate reductase n=1 Tax=Corynebacterium caspium TaxID=234828 RepID=UPI0003821327|nr:pyrroline-5-carboxylate reductase [Corynebacterium caspium]WKD59914.1 Pyrroline-5-carboxylate reductase [Corynebacterium caspium DSM 44850]